MVSRNHFHILPEGNVFRLAGGPTHLRPHSVANAFADDKFVCPLIAMFIHVQGAGELSEAITGDEKTTFSVYEMPGRPSGDGGSRCRTLTDLRTDPRAVVERCCCCCLPVLRQAAHRVSESWPNPPNYMNVNNCFFLLRLPLCILCFPWGPSRPAVTLSCLHAVLLIACVVTSENLHLHQSFVSEH